MKRSAARRLEGWLSRELGAPVCLESSEKLGGGTGRTTWQVTVAATGARGGRSRRQLRVVRREMPPGPGTGRSPAEEFALLGAAHDAGVLVPPPLFLCQDAHVLGAPFFVTDCVPGAEHGMRPPRGSGDGARGPGLGRDSEGERERPAPDDPPSPRERIRDRLTSSCDEGVETFMDSRFRGNDITDGKSVTTDVEAAITDIEPVIPAEAGIHERKPNTDVRERESISSAGRRLGRSALESRFERPELARQLGRELAKLHRITPAGGGLRFLAPAPRDQAGARIASFRGRLDAIGDPQPVLEWAMRQLERNAPESGDPVLCLGAPGAGARSCLVEEGRLLAITDWAASGWGDPYEDLGEFCAACRRLVSRPREADGAASRAAFLGGYRETSGLEPDGEVLRYWEVMATLRSAVAALEQGHRFAAGSERSIERALAGRRAAEREIDLLVETDRLAMAHAHA